MIKRRWRCNLDFPFMSVDHGKMRSSLSALRMDYIPIKIALAMSPIVLFSCAPHEVPNSPAAAQSHKLTSVYDFGKANPGCHVWTDWNKMCSRVDGGDERYTVRLTPLEQWRHLSPSVSLRTTRSLRSHRNLHQPCCPQIDFARTRFLMERYRYALIAN